MTPEMLKTELDLAEEAELQSEEQLRQLTALIDTARAPNATINASDCAKLVSAALALNERLRDRAKTLRIAAQRVTSDTARKP
jgi:hypothetical protein